MSIEDDLKSWSDKVLEVPNPSLRGVAACSFARKAWLEDKVSLVECEDIFKQTIIECGNFDSENKSLVICASYTLPDADEMSDWVVSMNDLTAKTDLHLVAFHPENGTEEAQLEFLYDPDWGDMTESPYCMIFIQSSLRADDASIILEGQGFYDTYHDDELNELIFEKRSRMQSDETSIYEEETYR